MAQANIDKVKDFIASDAELQQRLQKADGESALLSTLIGIGKEKRAAVHRGRGECLESATARVGRAQ